MSAPRIVILPAYNEAKNLPTVLAGLSAAERGYEVVVIDDGSDDDTARIAAGLEATVLRHPFNLGYGAALQTGYKYALRRGATVLVQMDADGQHDPNDIARLVAPLREERCDLVIGSRFLSESGYEMGVTRSLGRRLFLGVGRLFGLQITDPTSGFQAMNRAVLELYAQDFFPADYPDVNVLLAAHRAGLRIGECPVEMSESMRPSTLHIGLRPIYYVYKMLLSTWAASARRPR